MNFLEHVLCSTILTWLIVLKQTQWLAIKFPATVHRLQEEEATGAREPGRPGLQAVGRYLWGRTVRPASHRLNRSRHLLTEHWLKLALKGTQDIHTGASSATPVCIFIAKPKFCLHLFGRIQTNTTTSGFWESRDGVCFRKGHSGG